MGWKSGARYDSYTRYGGYCNSSRAVRREPIPFHNWQELSMKAAVHNQYAMYCSNIAGQRKDPLGFYKWLSRAINNGAVLI